MVDRRAGRHEERSFVVGRISRPHGVEGALLVQPDTDRPEVVFVPGRELGVKGTRPGLPAFLTVREAAAHGRGWIVRVEELLDRTMAAQYGGLSLTLPEAELPALEEGEFFLHDLVGLRVSTVSGEALGEVTKVYETRGAPVLGIQVEGRERLVPFHRALVREVDMAEGRLVMELPAGLLEL